MNWKTGPTVLEDADPAEWIAVIAMTLMGLFLRLFHIGDESIWYDESFSLRLVATGVAPLLTGQVADPGNPAGYFVLLALWSMLFGNSIEAARTLSAVFGAATIVCVWQLARTLTLSRSTRTLALLLATVSPPLIYLSREARCYSMFIFIATLLAIATERCARLPRLRDWVVFVIWGVLAVHVHYYGFFILIALGLRLFILSGSRLAVVAAALAIAAGFAPYLAVFLWQLSLGSSRSGETWWQHLALLPIYSLAGRTLVWKEHGQFWVAVANAAAILLVYLPILRCLVRNRNRLWTPIAASAGVLAVATLASVLMSPMIHSHYISSALPPLLILVAFASAEPGIGDPQSPKWIVPLVLTVAVGSLDGLYRRSHKTDWRAVANLIAERANGLPIYFFEDIGADPYRYYRPGDDCRLIIEPFAGDGASWTKAGWLAKMQQDRDGFALIYYATNSENRASLPSCTAWLKRNFEGIEHRTIGPVGPIECYIVAKGKVKNT